VIVALCSAINLSEQAPKALPPQSNTAFGANRHESRSLSFAERVAYQRAVEDVYWRHRIWPKECPDPKPSLDAVMSQAQIEKKVEGYLRNSQVVDDHWHRPITADQLQSEMERMATHTKQPEVLRKIFEVLGNDPFVVAECLARPVLAERLVNGDPVAAEPALSASRKEVSPAQPTRLLPQKLIAQRPVTISAVSSANYTLPVIAGPLGGCIDDTWTPTTQTGAPVGRSDHTAVWTGSEMIVWGGNGGSNTGGRYNPSTDSWTATSLMNAPSPRYQHTAVWTGSEMIVWGGYNGSEFNTGGRYNPITDSWTATSTINAPSARRYHTAVWTGTEMIVWGGYPGTQTNIGGRYNPNTDSWTATSATNAPSYRGWHTAVLIGSEMIIWGGSDLGNPYTYYNTGGRYNFITDNWTATSTTNAPSPRIYHTAVSTGSEMVVWGGGLFAEGGFNTGGRYNPSTDSWTATSLANAPPGRQQLPSVWTGSEMIVWGGTNFHIDFNSGGRYNPVTDSWTATSTTNAPPATRLLTAVWTGSEMIVWGGCCFLSTGGRYCASGAGPTPTPTASPSPTATATVTATATATAAATATPTVTPTATASSTPRSQPTPRARPTPAPRP
jgi:N-acetylneuraminic acid mutarotase